MVHAAGDAGWVAWTNGVDALTAAHTADLASKLDSTVASSTYAPLVSPDSLRVGESTIDRNSVISYCGLLGSGIVHLTNFTAKKTETINTLVMITGGTAAGATPSLVRMGVWTTDDDGHLLAMVASTANDTTLFGTTATEYARATQAPWNKVAGTRYAFGVLMVSSAAMPNLLGHAYNTLAGSNYFPIRKPTLMNLSTGQSDLPATWPNAVYPAATLAFYAEMRP